MKASEYIAVLYKLIDEYGDLECVDAEDSSMPEPEEVEGVFVLADRG